MKTDYTDITCDRALKELARIDDAYLMMQIKFAQDSRKRIDFFEKTMVSMFQELEMYRLIHSIPGFGTLSSAYFTSINEFPSERTI